MQVFEIHDAAIVHNLRVEQRRTALGLKWFVVRKAYSKGKSFFKVTDYCYDSLDDLRNLSGKEIAYIQGKVATLHNKRFKPQTTEGSKPPPFVQQVLPPIKEEQVTLTGWFSGDVRPVRGGWYERKVNKTIVRQYWNMNKWVPLPEIGDSWSYCEWRGIYRPIPSGYHY
jgi:hypothetical protein